MRAKTSTLLAVAAATITAASAAPTWEQWRGPARDGRVATGSPAWPAKLENLQKEWRVELAEGYSSPVVTAEHVFTVETKDKKDEIVRAFDRKTGDQIWEKSWAGSMKVPFFAAKNGSWVRCTPSYANGILYVGGMRDVLVALDAKTGDEVWRADFVDREGTPLPGFGFVSSPVVDGEHLYVQAGSQVLKLNAKTGEKIWGSLKDDRAMYGSAFSSPTISTIAGKRQLLVQTREELAGLDLESGQKLWGYKVKAFRGMNILTPTQIGDALFTSTYGGGSFLFTVSTDGEAFDASKTWVDKTEGYMSSPITHNGHVYMHGRDKRFHCFDVESGELKWTTPEKFGEYASLVAHGEQMLALTCEGELLLIDLSPEEFRVVGRQKVADAPTWAHLAVVGDELYIRELKAITKWRWPN